MSQASLLISHLPHRIAKKINLAQSYLTLCDPMDCIACQALPCMGFPRQEYWSELLFPSPGESSQPRDKTWVSRIAGRHFTL